MKTTIELQGWFEQAREELEQARAESVAVQRRVTQAEERCELLQQLISLEGGDSDRDDVSVKKGESERPTTSDTFVDQVIEIIREHGTPMHIGDLHEELLDHQVPIPGKGAQANIIARIQRSDGQVIRVGRGLYGLPEFGLDEAKPIRRRRSAQPRPRARK